MVELSTETLIVGAGPAGLACAIELSNQKKDFIVIERDGKVGGLSKTYEFKEADGSIFYTDNGPHRFFSKNPYLYKFIGELLGDDWIKVKRQTRQYIDGKFYDYPINATQALKNIGFAKAVVILFDYICARISYGLFRKPIRNFEDYAIAYFGRSLAQFNMINYTEKIWGIPASEIHPDWASQRIRGLKLMSVFLGVARNFFGFNNKSSKTMIDEFYYPKKGTGDIYEKIKQKLECLSYKIMLQTWPTKIRKIQNGFRTELINLHGEIIIINSKYLVESVPIGEFIKLIDETKPTQVNDALKKLHYRSQVYVFVTLNKDFVTRDQWIYFPEKNIPIGRVSEMKNFSLAMSPEGKTSLFIELFCFEGDEIWTMCDEKIVNYILPFCEKLNLFKKSEIRQTYVIHQKNCYPIYDLVYKDYLNILKSYLNSISNLFFIGRPGRFRYNNQDHSLEMGILAAKSIIEDKIYNMEAIDEGLEYFENGKIPR